MKKHEIGINMKRDASVEIYRCFLMFGIVLLHVICQGGYCQRGIDRILLSCVDGFVFISGYYGLRFSYKKVFRLVLIGLWCFIASAVVRIVIDTGVNELTFIEHVHYDITRWSWFLWAYIILMIFAPVFEVAFENLRFEREKLIGLFCPILLLVFGWMYMTEFPVIKLYIPKPSGFGVTTFLCLIGIYISARMFRYLNGESYMNRRVIICGIVICGGMCLLGFGHYQSIFALGMACLTFCLFKRIKFPAFIGNIAMMCAPSMFSIYLLHSNAVGFDYCKQLDVFFVEHCHIHVWCAWILTAVIIFFSSLCIDFIRRIFLWISKYIFETIRETA